MSEGGSCPQAGRWRYVRLAQLPDQWLSLPFSDNLSHVRVAGICCGAGSELSYPHRSLALPEPSLLLYYPKPVVFTRPWWPTLGTD